MGADRQRDRKCLWPCVSSWESAEEKAANTDTELWKTAIQEGEEELPMLPSPHLGAGERVGRTAALPANGLLSKQLAGWQVEEGEMGSSYLWILSFYI